ncbi:MAG: translesion error-prone DNA polymerase V autoproteolytic subunit [Cyanobacteria bacterium P01_D01_bin.6]
MSSCVACKTLFQPIQPDLSLTNRASTLPRCHPESMLPTVLEYVYRPCYALPFYSCSVAAGFPSPADDHLDGRLNLDEHLIRHPSATFIVRAAGDSMIGAGIHHNDLLIVDRSLEATDGKVVIAAVDGELTVKRLRKHEGKVYLMPENSAYPPLEMTKGQEMVIWGVVTTVIHPV